jgi:hypothetical protein
MKSKNSLGRRVKKGDAALDRAPGKGGRAVIIDFVQSRIEAFNEDQGGGIAVRKDRTGYTLVVELTGVPVARLRPDVHKGSFEVLYWCKSRERWQRVGEWGVSLPSLDEALEFIATDPMDCFWM